MALQRQSTQRMLSTISTFKLYQFTSITGCFLATFWTGLPWYWGNLSVYIASSLRVNHDIKANVLTAWTPSIYLLTWSIPAIMVHFVVLKLGKHWTLLLGIAIAETGLLLGWLGTQYPEIPLEIGFGVIFGLGSCFIYTVCMLLVLDWTDTNSCFITSCLQASFSLGAIVINQTVTSYINPFNDKIVTLSNSVPFFNQIDVNKRVPQYLLFFIIITSAISLLAVALIRNKYSCRFTEVKSNNVLDSMETDPSQKNDETSNLIIKKKEYTALDILKNKIFYVLVYSVFSSDVAYLVSTTYYKQFGQTFISDDQFLTFAGMMPPISIFAATLLVGTVVDRVGPKIPMMIVNILLSLSSLLFYFSWSSKWLFFLWLQMFMASGATSYNLVILACIKIFGINQFLIKYTMLFSISIISTLTIPIILKKILLLFSWFGLFASASIGSILAQILIAIVLPHS